MPRPSSPFAAPPPKKAPTVKRDTAEERAEKDYVLRRDLGCIGGLIDNEAGRPYICDGPFEIDHVRASGGLGIKSPTHRSNLVKLCRHHHALKTYHGKVWRPLLLAYLERVEQ